jgi:uncharacterized protein (TIGR02646 family)
MVELKHRATAPPILTDFLASHPNLQVEDFNSLPFQTVKKAVKAALHEDQAGLCVYCERLLDSAQGQVEHILPKAGKNARPALAFTYTNLAHGCNNTCTCGQKKGNGLLPITPGPGCNSRFMLSTNGVITPLPDLSRKEHHLVLQTLKMLGLAEGQSPVLEEERKKWLDVLLHIYQQYPDQAEAFMVDKPFRYIFRRLFD